MNSFVKNAFFPLKTFRHPEPRCTRVENPGEGSWCFPKILGKRSLMFSPKFLTRSLYLLFQIIPGLFCEFNYFYGYPLSTSPHTSCAPNVLKRFVAIEQKKWENWTHWTSWTRPFFRSCLPLCEMASDFTTTSWISQKSFQRFQITTAKRN